MKVYTIESVSTGKQFAAKALTKRSFNPSIGLNLKVDISIFFLQ